MILRTFGVQVGIALSEEVAMVGSRGSEYPATVAEVLCEDCPEPIRTSLRKRESFSWKLVQGCGTLGCMQRHLHNNS